MMRAHDTNEEFNTPSWTVRGLRLPTLLVALLGQNLWRHPGDEALQRVMPWFEDPLWFPETLERMRFENRSLDGLVDDPASAELFREARGSRTAGRVDLPWLDVESAVLVAVNQNPGDDVALALDYRTDVDDPRVVASDFWTLPTQCSWRVVTPTFSELVTLLWPKSCSSAGR